MMMDFLKIKKLYFVNSKVSNFNRDSDISCWEPCFFSPKITISILPTYAMSKNQNKVNKFKIHQ